MDTKFWLGFLLGCVISLILSMGIFYYYVVSEIESTKNETKAEYKAMKELWNKNLKNQYDELKESTLKKAGDKLNDLQEKILKTEKDSSSKR